MLEARDVGRAMERLRGDRTQRSVAQRAGINRSSWSSYEAGRRMPGPDTYPKVARGLGCSEDELDQAVLRSWSERLREEATGEDEEATVLVPPGLEVEGVLGLTSGETMTLLVCSDRIQDVLQTLLRRQGVTPGS